MGYRIILMMSASQKVIAIGSIMAAPSQTRLVISAIRYLGGKALTIFVTIFSGVFFTILVVNFPTDKGNTHGVSPFELRLEKQIDSAVRGNLYDGHYISEEEMATRTERLRTEAGLNLPSLPRNLLWTFKALTFNWGKELSASYYQPLAVGQVYVGDSNDNLILQYFPRTLLLIGTAYLLVFLLGLPIALYLARNHGTWLDRLMTVLSPISSVPSWVFAILLISIFAVQLHWLPLAGMYDVFKPQTPIGHIIDLSQHMLLPICALVLSLLFQLVYAWRTFFVIYSEEDYVELARAKGLKNKTLERQYILKPALPYIITSFTASLIGFWQLTVVIEKVFQWPGIGLLYIKALPNYWGENVAIGDLMIVIQIVVIFAYLLGMLVFVLDLVYVIVDPRIHLSPNGSIAQIFVRGKSRDKVWMKHKGTGRPGPVTGPRARRRFSPTPFFRGVKESMRESRARNRLFLQELRSYPSAIFGLIIIAFLLAGSIYAVLALPYQEFGKGYDENRLLGRNLRPRVAAPVWFNYFSMTPRLSTLIMDENSAGATVSTRMIEDDIEEKTITFEFEYEYAEMPDEIFLYLDPKYEKKIPFAALMWITPDGRTIDLKSVAADGNVNYDFTTGVPIPKLLKAFPEWGNWFVSSGQYPTSAFTLLFAKPESAQQTLQRGTYQLKVTSLLFEENSDLHPQIVLLGQVYGVAGTDYWRRDLILPLFWGMPFALFIGFLGTLVTILIAMLLPAVGVWFGGGLDNLIQRLSEVNMILPGLAIAVLLNLIFGTNIWIVLCIIVLLNALGSPIKSFRSAFLQAKEAPYIEVARSYGASNFRIIMHYLVPRIMPMFVPQLITQIPGFIFLEATLGFFNINSNYPSWGRIIYDGLSHGALYGSPFWVLEPIFLLLLTGLAFAMLGSALERILNPRIIDSVPIVQSGK